MSKTLPTNLYLTNRKAVTGLTLSAVAVVALALTQDFLRAQLNNSGFYFSESFMFSSFWWIFVPLLSAQYFVVQHIHTKPLAAQLSIITLPLIVHLLAFPFLVWALSKVFYYHTFAFQQTLRYTVSEHFYQLVLFYTIPFFTWRFFHSIAQTNPKTPVTKQAPVYPFIDHILVSEGNKKHCIAVAEIVYFSASAPYISIHLAEKKYLQKQTLKSLSSQLHPDQFVRVHKSVIINMQMAVSYTSRLNGDYDLMMKNNVKLRVSRNFAPDFKRKFGESHRLTSK